MGWNFDTGGFTSTEEEPKQTTPTSTTTPPPEQTDSGWGGGFFSDLAHVAGAIPRGIGRATEDLASVVRALPQAVPQIAKNLNRSPADPEYIAKVRERERQAEQLGLSGLKKEIYMASTDPVLQVAVPGSFVAEKAVQGKEGLKELGEHPGFAALDVLPVVSKGTRVLTKGGRMAGRAAETFEAAGKPHITADIAEKGLKPTQVVGQLARDVETKLVPRSQRVAGIRPQLEELGLTARARSVQDLVGQAQREVSTATQRFADEVSEAQKRFGVSPERTRELTTLARLEPEAIGRLPDGERQLLMHFDEINRRHRAEDITRGEGFMWGQDFYSKAEAPELASIARRKAFYDRIAESAERRTGQATERSVNIRRAQELEAQAAEIRRQAFFVPDRSAPEWHARLREADRLVAEGRSYRPGGGGRYTRQAQRARRKAEELQGLGDTIAATHPPTAWHDVLRQRALDEAKENIRRTNTPEAWDEMFGNLESGAYHRIPGFSEADWKALVDAQWTSWQRLRDEGFEPPMFVSHAPLEAAQRLQHPYFIPKGVRRPGSTKARMKYDYRPFSDDLAVAARYDHLERVQRMAAEDFVGKLRDRGWIKDDIAVMDEMDSMLGHLAKGEELKKLRDKTLQKFYRRYVPESIFTGQALGVLKEGDYIPTGVYRLLEDMARPPKKTILGKPLEWGAGLLRTSVLRLNPFYYLGNAISGVPLLLAKGRVTDLRYLPEAMRMVRRGEVPTWVPTGPRKIVGDVENVYAFRAGTSIGDMLADHWGPAKYAQRATLFSDKVVTILDDMWRTTAALAEQGRALKKGRAPDVAIAQAVDFASKVMNNLDRLTPTERFVVKSVFPFYSWSAHLLRYVMSYPFDHPWRAMFVSKLARQSIEEWDEDVPRKMMRYIALGERDPEGWQWFLGANDLLPWVSISEIGSMSGLMSRLHPGYKAALQYAGLDPFAGGPERYPEYTETIDPVTGKESYVRTPLGELLAENLLPMSEFMTKEDWQAELQKEKPQGDLEELLRLFGANAFQRKMEGPAKRPVRAKPARTPAPAASTGGGGWNYETGRFE